jgi:flagellar biosynthesis regulator FlbT
VEHGKSFLKEMYVNDEDEKKKSEEAGSDDAAKNSIKRIKKRLQIFKEREVTRELYRLDQPIANNEQAIAYRAKKV